MNAEVVYESPDTRVIVTDNPLELPRAGQYNTAQREVVGEKVRIFNHYYWPPLDFKAEIWVYPRPRSVEVQTNWEPEWTYLCDMRIKSTTTVTVVVVLNGVIHEIIHVIPVPTRRRGWRRVAK